MPDWGLHAMCAVGAIFMLGRPAIMFFFPDSSAACWLEETFPETFDGDGDCGDGGDGGD
ncbi:MAG: hypothetical protein ACSHXH_01895 [Marivita sp.]|uniref:hypothetical protein n=1 Tax=Marivita sp. TaxID=2003365 RepID=UPI003EFABBC2